MVRRLPTHEQELVATVLWALWFARNQLVFQDKVLSQSKVIDLAKNTIEDFRVASRTGKKITPATRERH